MSPYDVSDDGLTHMEQCAKASLCKGAACVQRTDRYHIGIRQFSIAVLLPILTGCAAFMGPILIILCERAEAKMLWIATATIITTMEHAQPRHDVTMGKHIGESWGQPIMSVQAEDTIAAPMGFHCPGPARRDIAFNNVSPKIINGIRATAHRSV